MAERKSTTLFVRNLSYSTTNNSLISTFEDIGPIKTAFAVCDKETGKCRGFGYVKFSMLDDAVKAKDTITHCDGRKVSISFADAKKARKLPKSSAKDQEAKGQEESKSEDTKKKSSKKVTPVVVEKGKKGEKPAKPHAKKAASILVSGKPTPKPPKTKALKRCRLIVRNLSFKCTEEVLKKVFAKFGEITEATIPLKNGTKSRGFGFVQFANLGAAQKAVAEMNAKEIVGRPVAVDWAVAKDRFESKAAKDDDADSEEESGIEDGGESEKEESASGDETSSDKEDEEEDESESDDDDDDENDSESTDEENEASSDDDEEMESGKDDESDDDQEEESPKSAKKPVVPRKSDVEEGRTLFVRNIPFSAEEEEVEELFAEFGELSYVRLVVDKATGQPRGTAFVQFKTKQAADECLAKVQQGGRENELKLQGRPLNIILAVSKNEVVNPKPKDTKDQKDNRNLFLAREGLIREGTQAAIGVSPSDMTKRLKVEMAKRSKLKDINVFVSSTRLCVHNLPIQVDENQLRKVLRKLVDDPTARITECRIMKATEGHKGRSLGYAFVNFATHEHALKALKSLNNSPVFGDKRRPIVEFSLENRRALETKQRRLEKSKLNLKRKKEEESGEVKTKAQGQPSKKQKLAAWAGKKEQDAIARSIHKGPKGMPKRMGPKIRHRNRGKQNQKNKKLQGKKNAEK